MLSNRRSSVSAQSIENPEFRIIGSRKAGKTTFLAALAYYPNIHPDSVISAIHPLDDETAMLVSMAQDILENGLSLSGTRLEENVVYLPSYSLLIETKAESRLQQRLQLSCRDYPGEIFDSLGNNSLSSEIIENYLDDCASVNGLLIMIDGTSTDDRKYARCLDRLKAELNLRLVSDNRNLSDYRLGVIFSKAEQSSVWVHRRNIDKFKQLKFPRTSGILTRWSQEWQCSVNYFLSSAYGMMGAQVKPNFRLLTRDSSGTTGVISKPRYWKPVGLIEPVYWLSTSQNIQMEIEV